MEPHEHLLAGDLVVFPTETVYGLGANALDPDAVAAVFAAKGRPSDNPLIVHVPNAEVAQAQAGHWPDAASRLAAAFWPGPLSLVVLHRGQFPPAVTAALETVALRVPAHPIALNLLQRAGIPVVAPSANRSGRPSPTRVEHAQADLGDRVAAYLDGGPCEVGMESTVVDVTVDPPQVLRWGRIGLDELQAVVPGIQFGGDARRSPGTRHRHYAPRVQVRTVTRADATTTAEAEVAAGRRVGFIGSTELDMAHVSVALGDAPRDWMAGYYHALRTLEEDVDLILIEARPRGPEWDAVRDRLERSAQG